MAYMLSSMLTSDSENLYHRIILTINVIKHEQTEDKHFLVSIYNLPNDIIKLTMINMKFVSEQYTATMSQSEFEEIKNSQQLLISFYDFPEQLKILINQVEEGKKSIKLKIDTLGINLVFYTMSDVKELTILSVPFYYTSKDDVIAYLQRRHDTLETKSRNLLEKNNVLHAQVIEQKKQHQELLAALERTYEEKKKVESHYAEEEQKSEKLQQIVEDLSKKNKILLSDVQLFQKTNSELNYSISDLRSDIDSLKIGIEYYIKKTTHLQSVLTEKEKATIPKNKYEKLNNMFTSAIADLLKSQLNMKQILSQHEFQKSENFALKDELTNCITIIKNLEEKLHSTENKPSPSDGSEENCDMLTEMIKKLEILNSAKSAEYTD